MPVVFIPTPLRGLTGGVTEISLEGSTVGALVDALDSRFPGLKERLCRGDSLSPGLQISIDHVMTRRGLLARVRPESEVHFLPVIGGG
ncbi:MAG: MoaD/ThiS family protein [Isosphaeraceae bacterium]|jgi:molybdopterin synthase sulfur carrier subunit